CIRVWPRLLRSTGPRTVSTTATVIPFPTAAPSLSRGCGRVNARYDHRMPALPQRADRRGDHLIVCGDGPLSYRITEELTSRYGERVTVILPDRRNHHGPQISALPRVRVLEYPELSSQAVGPGAGRGLAGRRGQPARRAAGAGAQPRAPAGAGHLQPAAGRAHQDALPGLHG